MAEGVREVHRTGALEVRDPRAVDVTSDRGESVATAIPWARAAAIRPAVAFRVTG